MRNPRCSPATSRPAWNKPCVCDSVLACSGLVGPHANPQGRRGGGIHREGDRAARATLAGVIPGRAKGARGPALQSGWHLPGLVSLARCSRSHVTACAGAGGGLLVAPSKWKPGPATHGPQPSQYCRRSQAVLSWLGPAANSMWKTRSGPTRRAGSKFLGVGAERPGWDSTVQPGPRSLGPPQRPKCLGCDMWAR